MAMRTQVQPIRMQSNSTVYQISRMWCQPIWIAMDTLLGPLAPLPLNQPTSTCYTKIRLTCKSKLLNSKGNMMWTLIQWTCPKCLCRKYLTCINHQSKHLQLSSSSNPLRNNTSTHSLTPTRMLYQMQIFYISHNHWGQCSRTYSILFRSHSNICSLKESQPL